MRNLNFNGESGSEPYTPTAQSSTVPADSFYSPEFRGDFGAGLLDLHAMDDTELLSEVWEHINCLNILLVILFQVSILSLYSVEWFNHLTVASCIVGGIFNGILMVLDFSSV